MSCEVFAAVVIIAFITILCLVLWLVKVVVDSMAGIYEIRELRRIRESRRYKGNF